MSGCIKLYGERNTGTNYLRELISLNLDVGQLRGIAPDYIGVLQKVLPGREWLSDYYFTETFRQNLGWKHTCVEQIPSMMKSMLRGRKIHFITLTKNPYAWLLSLYRMPHHQYYIEKPDFETFLQTPWNVMGRDNCQVAPENPIELWNIKNSSYLQLKECNGLNITTEALMQDPEGIINLIGSHFSIDACRDRFLNLLESTRDNSKNYDFYRGYYLNERWRSSLNDNTISIINNKLDDQLMEEFGYKIL